MKKITINDLISEIVKMAAELLNGEYDETSNNVPRIIFTVNTANGNARLGEKISVVFLVSTCQWKAFYPFPSTEQKRIYFDNVKDLDRWLYMMGVCYA